MTAWVEKITADASLLIANKYKLAPGVKAVRRLRVRRSAAKELVDVDQSKKPRMPLSCAVFSVSADFTLSTPLLILTRKRRT